MDKSKRTKGANVMMARHMGALVAVFALAMVLTVPALAQQPEVTILVDAQQGDDQACNRADFVDDFGTIGATEAQPCETISRALQIAKGDDNDANLKGDRIVVFQGTYNERLNIDKPGLTLISQANRPGVIGGSIRAAQSGSRPVIEADLANAGGSPKLIRVTAANVTIDGFTLRDSKPNTTANGTVHAVRVVANTNNSDDASGFTLTNSIIEDLNARDRVRAVAVNVVSDSRPRNSVGTADNPTITDNVFRNLVVEGNAPVGGGTGEHGNRVVAVGLNGSFSGAEVSNNEFTDFRISPETPNDQTNTNKCIIHAVELSEDTNGDGPTDFSITENTFDNFDSCENTVNQEDVSSIGVFVGGLNSLGNHEISRNNFNFDVGSAPTLGAGVDTLASEEVDATNNWWGASDGPSTRSGISPGRMDSVSGANGSGVLVSMNVDFDPFMTSEITDGVIGNSANSRQLTPTLWNLFGLLSELTDSSPDATTNQPIEPSVEPLSLDTVQMSQRGANFTLSVRGQGIVSTEVQVYDLTGKRVASDSANGNTLRFRPLTETGQPLANGVYLYQLTVRGHNGETIRTDVRKFVVMR